MRSAAETWNTSPPCVAQSAAGRITHLSLFPASDTQREGPADHSSSSVTSEPDLIFRPVPIAAQKAITTAVKLKTTWRVWKFGIVLNYHHYSHGSVWRSRTGEAFWRRGETSSRSHEQVQLPEINSSTSTWSGMEASPACQSQRRKFILDFFSCLTILRYELTQTRSDLWCHKGI